jgi:hypothetical protein
VKRECIPMGLNYLAHSDQSVQTVQVKVSYSYRDDGRQWGWVEAVDEPKPDL